MFTIINSFKNIFRYRNKYTLFGILFGVIITVSSICIGVFLRMSIATNTIIREYAGVATVNTALKDVTDIYNLPDRLSRKDYDILKTIEHIDDIEVHKYNFNSTFIKPDVSPLDVKINSFDHIEAPIFIIGYNLSTAHLIPNEVVLQSGRMFENEYECIIAHNPKATDEDSIKWNNIVIGDTITIENNDGINKKFSVVGILEEFKNDTSNTNRRILYTSLGGAEYFDEFAPVEDTGIFGYNLTEFTIDDINSGADIIDSSIQIKMGYEILAYLDDPEDFFHVQTDLYKVELSSYMFTLEPLFTDFKSLLNITRVMENNSLGFTIITTVLLFVITIISTITLLNTRKYEIAVLRSVGMSKNKLMISYLIELLLFIWGITLISFIIAQVILPSIITPIFNNIQPMVSNDIYTNIVGSPFSNVMYNFCVVLGGASSLVVLSLLLFCIYIMKFEPIKIFNKQY